MGACVHRVPTFYGVLYLHVKVQEQASLVCSSKNICGCYIHINLYRISFNSTCFIRPVKGRIGIWVRLLEMMSNKMREMMLKMCA